jgi:hypothetical protein
MQRAFCDKRDSAFWGGIEMSRLRLTLGVVGFILAFVLGVGATSVILEEGSTRVQAQTQSQEKVARRPIPFTSFDLEVLVNGRPLAEYYARGRTYVEALRGAEYELRIRNPSSERVAVALAVDGLNTIDARHTSAWNSSKWVIEPYQTITIGGWQMSTERARRFYFTDERDSYGAKLGQTANLGVISAVIFRERNRAISVTPPRRIYEDREKTGRDDARAPSANSQSGESAKKSRGAVAQESNDDYAATGIGRSVRNDVRWVNMELESQPAVELTIRYEYYSALVKLGIVPQRPYYPPDPIRRREDARGFSPEPKN